MTFLQLEAFGYLDLGKGNRLEAIDIATIRAPEVGMYVMVMTGTARGVAGSITGHTVGIHDAVCQACLLEVLEHPEQGHPVRLVGKGALYIALRKGLNAVLQQIEHG